MIQLRTLLESSSGIAGGATRIPHIVASLLRGLLTGVGLRLLMPLAPLIAGVLGALVVSGRDRPNGIVEIPRFAEARVVGPDVRLGPGCGPRLLPIARIATRLDALHLRLLMFGTNRIDALAGLVDMLAQGLPSKVIETTGTEGILHHLNAATLVTGQPPPIVRRLPPRRTCSHSRASRIWASRTPPEPAPWLAHDPRPDAHNRHATILASRLSAHVKARIRVPGNSISWNIRHDSLSLCTQSPLLEDRPTHGRPTHMEFYSI